MEKLTDFKPIKDLVLPALGKLDCSGLLVIVGPNSSGKTQFLRDIKDRISGEPRSLVVAAELELDTPDHQQFLKCLKAEGYIYSIWDDNDQEQYVPMTTFVGTGQGAKNVASRDLEQWRTRSTQAAARKRKDEYFGWLSRFFVTALFLENRLTSLTTVNTIDFETQPPSNDLHALHLNDDARTALTKEVKRAFSKAVWSDLSRGSRLCLRISEDGQVPSADARLSVKEMAKYRTIESEGDGLKSYVATVISLLLGRRPVTVIDEPEMCLHPPQAYNLGQFIGENGTSQNTATFVATHSSQILRGIVQTAKSLQIVRLTRNSNGFKARRVDSAILAEAMKKPTVRAETVLDGIFSQAVAIIEADGDRIVYHAAWETVGGERNFDIHFAAVGGVGGIADTSQLYRVLGIPVAVIADLDAITDTDKVRRILEKLCDDSAKVDNLVSEVDTVAQAVKKLPPTISVEDARRELADLNSNELDWSDGGDLALRERLSALSHSLNGMRRIKAGGISQLPQDVATPMQAVVRKLASQGLFLVSVGELEEWLSGCGISASKQKKWAWANEAAEFIRTNPPKDSDIWQFIREVGEFLTRQFD
jgi:hypothetical protein